MIAIPFSIVGVKVPFSTTLVLAPLCNVVHNLGLLHVMMQCWDDKSMVEFMAWQIVHRVLGCAIGVFVSYRAQKTDRAKYLARL